MRKANTAAKLQQEHHSYDQEIPSSESLLSSPQYNFWRLLLIPSYGLFLISIILCIYYPLSANLNKYFEQSSSDGRLTFISSIADLREIQRVLSSDVVWMHHGFELLALFSAVYIFNQTFCIPGSVIMNITAGAFLGLFKGMLLVATYVHPCLSFINMHQSYCLRSHLSLFAE